MAPLSLLPPTWSFPWRPLLSPLPWQPSPAMAEFPGSTPTPYSPPWPPLELHSSPWRHPLQFPLCLGAPPCSIFFLCSRPLAAMALASAPCAACSARQGWRSSAEPLPSMGQWLLPRRLPLMQQPWQLHALATPRSSRRWP
ncbi:hypothetical protein ZEAMMB73_Zm00001d040973 [Zea mays]|uniref:Uncharacterized protein n=1 Tax=Zea mays TaxID=4577 RepID=A0A1D6MTM5_MAIZE|nr:hypothetical protein ZEAMMB73_Zm00001d040973 [Zea mays]